MIGGAGLRIRSLIHRYLALLIFGGLLMIVIGLTGWGSNLASPSVVGYTLHVYSLNGAYFVGDPPPTEGEYIGYVEVYPVEEPWPETSFTPFRRVTLNCVQFMLDYPIRTEEHEMLPDTSNFDWMRGSTLSAEALAVPEFAGDVSKLGKSFVLLSKDGLRRILFMLVVIAGSVLLLMGSLAGWRQLRQKGRTDQGLCGGCGYDRRGLVGDAACPECGSKP